MVTTRAFRPVVSSGATEGRTLSPGRPRALSALRHFWKSACLGILLSAAAALLVAYGHKDRQEFTGSILYAPLPPAEAGKHFLAAEDLKSLSALLKSPQHLQPVVDSLQLSLSADDLAERIETKVPVTSQTLLVSLRWAGQEDGEVVLNRLLESFIATTGRMRGDKVRDCVAAYHSSLLSSEQSLARAREGLADFYRRHGIQDPTHEIGMLTVDLQALVAAMSLARRNQSSYEAQVALISKTIDKVTSEEPAKGKSGEGVAKGPAAGKHRLNPGRLYQLIQEERRLQEGTALLQAKQRDYERAQKLVSQRAISQAELDRIQGEVDVLEAQVRGNDKIQQWKQELAEPDWAGEGPTMLHQAFVKKLDLDLQLLGCRKEQDLLSAEAKGKRALLDRVLQLQTEAAPLAKQVELKETEREALRGHLEQLKLMGGLIASEATIIQPAVAVARPFGSSRQWLIPVAVLCGGLLSWGGLLLVRESRLQARTGEQIAAQMGLPVLARVPAAAADQVVTPEVRAFTLSLRQRLPEPGSSLLFATLQGGPGVHELLRQTATSLAERDERVLLLQAVLPSAHAGTEEDPAGHEPGLKDYLAFEVADVEEVIQSTPVFGVDLLSVGTASLSPDALATYRMRDLLEQLRHTYTVILIEGPPVTAVPDLQILASYVDGVVLALETHGAISAAQAEALRAHQQVGVPLLGCVTVTV